MRIIGQTLKLLFLHTAMSCSPVESPLGETRTVSWGEASIDTPLRFEPFGEDTDPEDGQHRSIFTAANRNQVLVLVRGPVTYSAPRFRELVDFIKSQLAETTPGLRWTADSIVSLDGEDWSHLAYLEPRGDSEIHVLMMTTVHGGIQYGAGYTIQQDFYSELHPEIFASLHTVRFPDAAAR